MTKKQQRFADEYLRDCNAAQAAIRAGYSVKTARSQGQRMLTIVDVKAYIDEKLKEISSDRIADVKEIMEFYTGVMRGEIKDQFGLDSSLSDRLSAGRELLKRYERTEGSRKDETEDNGLVKAIKEAVAAREKKS